MKRIWLLLWCLAFSAGAEVGDPQIRTDHPWYPGELAISTFERLFETQAEAYERVTGKRPESDEEKALAAWFWRNTHFWHGQVGGRDLWGKGVNRGGDTRLREYWTGLFGYGFGLCGTTHSQWTAEMEHLLGHGRGRGVGVAGHNAFEVFLQGGPYGEAGRWALLDHDLSTVIFDAAGDRLLSIREVHANVDRWVDRGYRPERQRGWLVCGLHPGDGASYRDYAVSEYLAGYAGPPPVVHLKRGERMRRYFSPGLEPGDTFVFWGRNANSGGIPGPERSRTWVNQPEKMHGSRSGTPHREGQARYANVEYVYRPDFTTADYKEGVIEESGDHLVIGFRTPYIIAATPADLKEEWGIYEDGCRNGLVLNGQTDCRVSVSVDAGRTWSVAVPFQDGLDLTDQVKGRAQYWLRFGAGAGRLRDSGLEIRTVCQANVAVLPRLKDGGTRVTYEASNQSVLSLGPEARLAEAYVIDGGLGESSVTFGATSTRPVSGVFAAAHVASGNPPDPKIRYQVEVSTNSGREWIAVVKDWRVEPRGDEPGDFWSQSFCYGSGEIKAKAGTPVWIRFRNDGGRRYLRAEAHLLQQTADADPVRVSYDWTDDAGDHRESHLFPAGGTWDVPTGRNVITRWVEFLVGR